MNRKLLIASCAAALYFTGIAAPGISAETDSTCASYVTAVTPGNSGVVPVVSDALLSNWKLTVSCVVPLISGIKEMRATSLPAQTRAKFLAAAGALRTIATNITSAQVANNKLPPEQQKTVDTIQMFQDQFRSVQSFETFVVLVTAARSDDYDMRLSAILVLGNVMDERYVCIPLIQLFDTNLQSAEYFVKARANLLGMISRSAPFVYKEDFANIRKTVLGIEQKVSPTDAKLDQTKLILQNIWERLAGQLKDGNTPANIAALRDLAKPIIFAEKSDASSPLKREFKDRCVSYMGSYQAIDDMKANIKYQ